MIFNEDYHNFYKNFRYFFLKSVNKRYYNKIISYYYKKLYGRKIDLINPQYLSEKILWLILYDKNPIKTTLSDRLQAKKYITKYIPELKVANIYQTASSFDKLDFDLCPEQFVIKTNHAWKSHILIQNKKSITKQDYSRYKKFYKKVLRINMAYWGILELQYKNIIPQIYTEEYLCQKKSESNIKEYEVYCFNENPLFINYIVSPSDTCDANKYKNSNIKKKFC